MSNLKMEELEKVSGGKLTNDQAYKKALQHANKTKTQAQLRKNELDMDDGILKYEIEFTAGGMEYEYDIDANTGAVLKAEQDFWD